MNAETNHVFDEAVKRLASAVGEVEGHYFGGVLRFITIHNRLHHSCEGGWKPCHASMGDLPGLREFSDELNAAIRPVLERYAVKLRQDLANACTKLGAEALKPSTFR